MYDIFDPDGENILPTSEIIAIFVDEMFFLDADVFIQPRENHKFSDDDSGGEDPDADGIQLSGNQLRGQAELL